MKQFICGVLLGVILSIVSYAFANNNQAENDQTNEKSGTNCRTEIWGGSPGFNGRCSFNEVVTRIDRDGTVYCSQVNVTCN